MGKITDYLVGKTNLLNVQTEITPGGEKYQMFNTGGVEVEVAELLYSLVRCWKPKTIVETGTHLGISALYMALGLQENGDGRVTTYEVIPSLLQQARSLWNHCGVEGNVTGMLVPSLDAPVGTPIDFLFLDSEPQFRFDEFNKFWPDVQPGGIIVIHDLHPSLGKHGQTYHGVLDWPYGEWEPKLSKYVKDLDVQVLHLPNPRGCTIFQKTRATDENIRYLRENA